MNKKQAFNIYMNKKQATKWALSKDNPNREKNKLQGGWTEEAKTGARKKNTARLQASERAS